MPSKYPHRIIGMMFSVAMVMMFHESSVSAAITSLIVSFFTSAGTPWDKEFGFSPDIDIKFFHRNLITHSTLLPFTLLLFPSSGLLRYALLAFFYSWASHVIMDLTASKARFTKLTGINYLAGLIITLSTLIYVLIMY